MGETLTEQKTSVAVSLGQALTVTARDFDTGVDSNRWEFGWLIIIVGCEQLVWVNF